MDRYTRLRGGSELWTNGTITSEIENISFWGIVQANKMWLKVIGVWKECITWVKISGVWKQSTPKVKVNGNWV